MDYEFAEFNDSEPSDEDEVLEPRQYRFRPFNNAGLNAAEFQQRFRFAPRHVEILAQRLANRLSAVIPTNHPLTVEQKILITLRFFATNDFYYSLGDVQGPTQKTVMRAIKQTTLAIIENLGGLVNWPDNEYENRLIARRFFQRARPHGFPNCVGAVDGTLIDIVAPSDTGGVFIGRQRRSCLNVLAVTDGGQKFLFMSSRFPGSVHDQRVFRRTLQAKFEHWRPFQNAVLIADSAYVGSDYLISMRERVLDPIERLFYESLAKTRSVIECLFGLWKNRFQVLKGATGCGPMRFRNPTVSATVVMACAILQNFLVDVRNRDEVDDGQFEAIEVLPDLQPVNEVLPAAAVNARQNRLREQMIAFRQANNL